MIPFVKKEFDVLSSTNTFLKEHYREFADYTVVRAKKQEKAYGRKNRKWFSPEGGLWFSFVVSSSEPFFWIMCSSVSITDNFEELKIKWPNDIYYEKYKVAGILSEKIEDRIIVGIGINVNNKTPKDVNAKTLKEIYSKEFNIEELFDKILERIYFNSKDRENTYLKWKEKSVILNKRITIKINGETIKGKVLDLCKDGGIILSDSNHTDKIIYGDIIDWEEI